MSIPASSSTKGLGGFLAPVLVVMVAGIVVPLGFIFQQSFAGDNLSLSGYVSVLGSALFHKVFWTTLEISLSTSVLSLLFGYPVALHLSRLPKKQRAYFAVLVLLPFWTSILVKSYAFIVILGETGIVNDALSAFGLPTGQFIFNRVGVLVGMVNFFIPFVVFPLLANLLSHDANLRKAAAVMGASPLRIFWTVTFPLSLPGVAAGFTFTFVLSLGFFVTPALLGGRHDMMIANLIDFYTRETLDWQTASVIAVLLLLSTTVFLLLLGRVRGVRSAI